MERLIVSVKYEGWEEKALTYDVWVYKYKGIGKTYSLLGSLSRVKGLDRTIPLGCLLR